ncbi:MAG: SPOR domain-containing protein [Thermoguttaceae bacterium]
MKATPCMRIATLMGSLVVLAGLGGYGLAQAPGPTAGPASQPVTLWSWLGIPQGIDKVRDALTNPLGNHPKLERKPPLKRIADPENLKSDNPAIQAAAKAKADADLAAQKIKAIKYLATVGCGCPKYNDQIKEALLAALDDCTEQVRYEAAMALCQTAGNVCAACNPGSCCDAKVMNKLLKVSEGKDEQGCWLESSARVRAAAAAALEACRQVRGPTAPVEQPKPGEAPREAPEKPAEAPNQNLPAPTGEQAEQPDLSAAASGRKVPARATGYTELAGPAAGPGSPAAKPSESDLAMVFGRGRLGRICPCPRYRPYAIVPEEAAVPAPPEEAAPAVPPEEFAPPGLPSPTALARGGPMQGVPNMIGDLFSSGGLIAYWPLDGNQPILLNVPAAGGDRRFKIADDNNPIPTDRVFFNYNMFNNALLAADGRVRDFNRFTFGLEKTFLQGDASVELRLPFGNGLDSTQSLLPGTPLMATEFGNIPLVFKALVARCEHQAWSLGMAVIFPTGSDGRLRDFQQEDVLVIENDAVHLQPFVGWLWKPVGRRLFLQGFGQIDFSTTGNDVLARPDPYFPELVRVGRFQDQNLLMLDLKIGYWLYANDEARWVTGVVPAFELHYLSTIQDADEVGGVTNPFNRVDALAATAGLHFLIGQQSTLTVAAAAPLRPGEDALFDAELLVQFNRRF